MYTIELYKKFDAQETYENVRWFTSLSAQEEYASNLSHQTITNCTPLLNNNQFKCRGNVNDYREYSYMRYWFTTSGGTKKKVIYCFIDDMEYVNEDVFLLHYTIDAFQTYMTEIEVKDSFIVREHATSLGKYIDEGLEVGEMVATNTYIAPTGGFGLYFAISCTVDPSNPDSDIERAGVYGGVPFAAPVFAMTYSKFIEIVGGIIQKGKSDAIIAVFTIPATFVKYKGTPYLNYEIEESEEPYSTTITCDKITALDGYTPTNSKLLTSPYIKWKVSNGGGQSVILSQEMFEDGIQFKFTYAPIQGCQAVIAPYKYNVGGYANANNCYAISSVQYASGSWLTDPYQTYLAQNGESDLIGLGAGIGTTAVNALTTGATTALATANPGLGLMAGLGTAVIGTASNAASLMQKVTNKENEVLTANGSSSSGSLVMLGHSFDIYALTCRKDVAESIDAYFTSYGYKVNRFGVPQMNTRSDFNYVELKQPCIVGAIPHVYLNQIIKAFERGVRLWHKSFSGL